VHTNTSINSANIHANNTQHIGGKEPNDEPANRRRFPWVVTHYTPDGRRTKLWKEAHASHKEKHKQSFRKEKQALQEKEAEAPQEKEAEASQEKEAEPPQEMQASYMEKQESHKELQTSQKEMLASQKEKQSVPMGKQPLRKKKQSPQEEKQAPQEKEAEEMLAPQKEEQSFQKMPSYHQQQAAAHARRMPNIRQAMYALSMRLKALAAKGLNEQIPAEWEAACVLYPGTIVSSDFHFFR
jgi:hypothetical protein